MIRKLYLAAAAWTVVGLAGGLFYREFTKALTFDGNTQLALVHTHALVLGTVSLLLVMALVKVFDLGGRPLTAFFWTWNAGMVLTIGGLVVKGCLQVLKDGLADSPALAGFSGLGHVVLTAAFVLLFLALRPAIASNTAGRRSAASASA